MDWKLTKSLYIVVFLLMNIALVYIYMYEHREAVNEIEQSPDILSRTNIDMENVEGYVPVEMNILTGTIEDFSNVEDLPGEVDPNDIVDSKITVEFEESGPTMLEQNLENYTDEYVYRGEEYRYDEVMSTPDQVIFNQVYEDFPIFNHEAARIVFRGEGRQVKVMEQTVLTNLEENEYTLDVPAKSPTEVVEELYEVKKISDEAVINKARLGYYIILTDDGNVMLRPKWELDITDQELTKTIYVDATTDSGEIIESE